METLLIIGIAGFIGANVRYWVSLWAVARYGSAFPWGTLIINVTGSALLGIFNGWAANHLNIDPRIRLFVAIGFFGAYTTFSTYANDTVSLMRLADWAGVLLDVFATNITCIGGALLGFWIGSHF